PACPALADEQPATVEGDAVSRWHVVAQHLGVAGGVAHADPPVHDLGGIEIAARVEGHVVGCDDVAALGADDFQLAGIYIECADLAAGHLCDVDPAVRPSAQTVGAKQPAGCSEPLQAPAFGEVGLPRGPVAAASAALRAGTVVRQSGPGYHCSHDSNQAIVQTIAST